MPGNGIHAYFDREEQLYKPRPYARSPWSATGIHGRLVAGLLARAIELNHGDEAFQFTRLTVDLFRMAPLAPAGVRTRAVREGNRIRLADALMVCEGQEVGRASAVMLRRGEQPEGEVWSPPNWDVPPPEDLEPRPREGPGGDPIREMRPIKGRWGSAENKQTWTRDVGELVAGEALTPFVRVAMAADLTSPLANIGTKGNRFLNADTTLYLHRLPIGEWIGFDVASHQSAQGVAVAACLLYDTHGPIGHSLVCSIADNRRAG